MEDALADLEALMVKWKDMVKLAQDLNERLTAASTPAPGMSLVPGAPPGGATTPSTQAVEPEEATFIRSSLAQLGLQMANAPVTQDMVRDERDWYEELAKELAGVLEGSGAKGRGGEGMMRKRGIVALDEVWGGWNRARGVGESLVIHKPQRSLDRCSLSVMENTLLTLRYFSAHTPGDLPPGITSLAELHPSANPHANIRGVRTLCAPHSPIRERCVRF